SGHRRRRDCRRGEVIGRVMLAASAASLAGSNFRSVGWAAGEVPVLRAFSVGPPPNRTCGFHRIRLSSVSFRPLSLETSLMDLHVALVADNQGLAVAGCHLLGPLPLFLPAPFL